MKNNNELKGSIVVAAFDAFAPCMQVGTTPADKRNAVKETIIVLDSFPNSRSGKKFAHAGCAADYCISAAKNLLRLAIVNNAPNMAFSTIQQLFETALEFTQNQHTPAA